MVSPTLWCLPGGTGRQMCRYAYLIYPYIHITRMAWCVLSMRQCLPSDDSSVEATGVCCWLIIAVAMFVKDWHYTYQKTPFNEFLLACLIKYSAVAAFPCNVFLQCSSVNEVRWAMWLCGENLLTKQIINENHTRWRSTPCLPGRSSLAIAKKCPSYC